MYAQAERLETERDRKNACFLSSPVKDIKNNNNNNSISNNIDNSINNNQSSITFAFNVISVLASMHFQLFSSTILV